MRTTLTLPAKMSRMRTTKMRRWNIKCSIFNVTLAQTDSLHTTTSICKFIVTVFLNVLASDGPAPRPFPWWRADQLQACANRAAWANISDSACLSACEPPGARTLAEKRYYSRCQSRQRAHWQVSIWVGTSPHTGPARKKNLWSKGEGCWQDCVRVTRLKQKAWGGDQSCLSPGDAAKTSRQAMKSSEQRPPAKAQASHGDLLYTSSKHAG